MLLEKQQVTDKLVIDLDIVFFYDANLIAKVVEEGFLNYDAKVVKWSLKDRTGIVQTFLS